MMALVVNLQRKLKLDAKRFTEFSQHLSSAIAEANGGDLAVAFVSDRRMKELNRFFRGKDATTDVLSFPHESDEFEDTTSASGTTPSAQSGGHPSSNQEGSSAAFLGDIVISVEQAQKQAEENGLTLENEIKQLILHGLLHLCGYDHETDDGEMNKRELGLRRKLKI
jgi:probable rRNA maturation factor